MKKILYSPEFGAGWVSWHHGDSLEQEIFMFTYQPLIDALEKGEDIGFDESRRFGNLPFKPGSVLEQFYKDFGDRFGTENLPYMGGARNLTVIEVDGPFRVHEYDGAESIISYAPEHYYDPAAWDETIDGEAEEILEREDIEI